MCLPTDRAVIVLVFPCFFPCFYIPFFPSCQGGLAVFPALLLCLEPGGCITQGGGSVFTQAVLWRGSGAPRGCPSGSGPPWQTPTSAFSSDPGSCAQGLLRPREPRPGAAVPARPGPARPRRTRPLPRRPLGLGSCGRTTPAMVHILPSEIP